MHVAPSLVLGTTWPLNKTGRALVATAFLGRPHTLKKKGMKENVNLHILFHFMAGVVWEGIVSRSVSQLWILYGQHDE